VITCERFEAAIEAYIGGGIANDDAERLIAHAAGCGSCRPLLDLHRELLDLAARAPEPDDADLERVRARVLVEVGRASRPTSPATAPPARLAHRGWRVPLAAAAAVGLLAAGVAAGRAWPARIGADPNGGVTSRLIAAIGADATANRELADVEDSRFTYSNVSFRGIAGDRVDLEFDVTTHVRLAEPVRSDLVREVLVHSLLDPASAGGRLKALSYATGAMEPKVKEALVFAMRQDETLAVRLKALTLLAEQPPDPQVEAAVLAALRDDEAVPMRLLALDYLAAQRVDHGRLREAIRESPRPGNEALQVRLASYEKRL
jgi:hypothetical protein